MALHPRTTGKVKNMPSRSPGNYGATEIPTVSSQNLGLPQQDRASPHSPTPSGAPGSPLCSLGASQTWSKHRGRVNGARHSQDKDFKSPALSTLVLVLKNAAWHQELFHLLGGQGVTPR